MNTKFSAAALATASFFALVAPAAAQGVTEQTPPQEEQAPAGATVSNETAADQGSAAEELAPGEIIVTATRRAERLQDVPLAVSALTGAQLQESGFQNLQDIQYQFSGVQFGVTGQDQGFRLRGVGTAGGFSSSSEQNVATVVDNVVVPFGNPITSLGDLDRVEVLKGPQGTQFGKNASSGVVNITTRRPDLNEFGGSAFVSYGSLDEHDIHGSLNIPIGGTAGFAVYAFHRQHDGFIRNVVRNETWGGTENYGVRAKLLFQPSDDFSAYLIGDYSKMERFGPGQLWTLQRLPPLSNPQTAGRFNPVLALGIVPGFNNTLTAEEGPGYDSEENFGVSLELNFGLGGDYNLTSVTAFRGLDDGPREFALDLSPLPIFTAQTTGLDREFMSQELRLSSPKGSAFEYIAGIYLSSLKAADLDDYTSAQLRPGQPFNPFITSITNGRNRSSTTSDSAAAFVDGTFGLTDTFKLIGGLRLQHDKVDAKNFSTIDPNFLPGPPGPPRPNVVNFYTARPLVTGSTSRTDWSGRAGFQFEPTQDLLFFGTVARGYLGPTVTFSSLTSTRVEVNPQTVQDITIGAKTQFFDRMLTLNGNVFYDKYKNLQTSVLRNNEFITENAGGFEAKGFEIEAVVRPMRRLSINAGYTFSDTKFTDYVTDCPANIQAAGAAAIAATCREPAAPGGVARFQARGESLPGAPKHSVTLGADFSQPIGSLELDLSANYYYRSRVQYNVGNPDASQPGYDTVGLSAGVGAADGAWRIGAFVRNLFDKRFHAAIGPLSFSAPGGIYNWHTREGRRTIGVSGEVRF